MGIEFKPIGYVHTDAGELPRHWSVSDVEGVLEILPEYEKGLSDIQAGQHIVVLFHFHRSAPFASDQLRQLKRDSREIKGVFSICSPRRPNPIGLSVLKVLDIAGCRIRVKGIDMFDGTPILDIKPNIKIP